jgi:uncharacterized protein YbjT (DUF2867 family)
MSKSILIFGATGKQGGSVLRALIEHPAFTPTEYTILAVTRDPGSPGARRLAELSPAIKLVKGDIAKAEETFRDLPATQLWGVYTMTTPSAKNETRQGIAIAEAAADAGAHRFVFSSVDRGPAEDRNSSTDVPHFITKHDIEKVIYDLSNNGKFTYTVIRPPFFLDNLQPGFFGKVLATIWRDHCPKTPMAVVDTRDIGTLAAAALLEPDNPHYRNKALNIAGDRLTFGELDEKFKAKTGSPVPTTYSMFASLPLFLVADFAKMVKFWQEPGFAARPEESKQLLHHLIDVDEWLDGSQHSKKNL